MTDSAREILQIIFFAVTVAVYGLLTDHSLDSREFVAPCHGEKQCGAMAASVYAP